jgi:hypothetical protein
VKARGVACFVPSHSACICVGHRQPLWPRPHAASLLHTHTHTHTHTHSLTHSHTYTHVHLAAHMHTSMDTVARPLRPWRAVAQPVAFGPPPAPGGPGASAGYVEVQGWRCVCPREEMTASDDAERGRSWRRGRRLSTDARTQRLCVRSQARSSQSHVIDEAPCLYVRHALLVLPLSTS